MAFTPAVVRHQTFVTKVGGTTELNSYTKNVSTKSPEKPLAQSAPGLIGILGGIVAVGLIIGLAFTLLVVYCRQEKPRAETRNDPCCSR
ncbi:hypothetical protein SKAU_G00324970 [Synaphobranchus kaupii]|uniref:Uncharacterized protein n=1 Tax=Synaphobranchus kaupii TaxID=118154 RepID=A0A9Q1IK96_SYNKA|nr:hypothetical protein SKAU_G00324970 [Synaphobranchus kaupii]